MVHADLDASAGLLDDEALIGRILRHLDGGTTDLAAATWHEPVDHYRSEERLRQEVEDVLRARPVPFCPSAALPTAGSFVARDAGGVPVLALRDREGRVRAFRNACRHRGTIVASGRGCSKSLVCPYHGWVYGLDGSLRHVPDEYGFPGLVKADRGLVPVHAHEQAGLVIVCQEQPATPSEAVPVRAPVRAPGPARGELPELIGSEQTVLHNDEIVVEANWKVLVEGFLEGYHLKATHRDTFLPFGYDNVNVVEVFGRNSRVTFPFRRIERLRHAPPEDRHIDGEVTFVYHLFPNVIVARLSHHTTMVVLEPLTVSSTRFVSYQLSSSVAASSGAARDIDFVRLGAAEDLSMALAVQRGLASGANQTLELGRFEGAITHFHTQLTALLDGSPTTGPTPATEAVPAGASTPAQCRT